MHIETIEELVDVLNRSPLTRLEVEGGDWSLSLERSPTPPARPARAARAAAPAAPEEAAETAEDTGELTQVESPIVGVFHEAPAPIVTGQRVRAGEALGSIEALALRNDVRSPVDGVVASVQVEEGQPVEYGQALFTLRVGESE